jgi:hypothetical protein
VKGNGVPRVIRIFDGRAGAPVRDDRFIPVIELVRSWNALGQPFLVPRRYTRTITEADEVRRLLYLSARYYCSCGDRHCNRKFPNVPHELNPGGGCPNGGQRISCRAEVVRDSAGRPRTQFRFFEKRTGIRSVIERHGADPSLWPYQARARKARA